MPATEPFSRATLNAIPLPVFVVDSEMVVVASNEAAQKMTGDTPELLLRRRSGDVVRCLHATGGCGHGAACGDCVVQQCVTSTLQGWRMVRQRTQLHIVEQEGPRQVDLLVTTTPFAYVGKNFALLVLEDITELVELRKLLPICARCKKIRDDQQYWHRLENYLTTNLNLALTHGYCPDCLAEMRRELEAWPGPGKGSDPR